MPEQVQASENPKHVIQAFFDVELRTINELQAKRKLTEDDMKAALVRMAQIFWYAGYLKYIARLPISETGEELLPGFVENETYPPLMEVFERLGRIERPSLLYIFVSHQFLNL